MIQNENLMREIVHGYRPVHGLNPPTPVRDRARIEKVADRMGTLTEYGSVELLYDLVRADLITFDEFYLLLGPAIRQPDYLAKRFEHYEKQVV